MDTGVILKRGLIKSINSAEPGIPIITDFPTDSLPAQMQKIISETGDVLGFLPDFIGSAMLAAAGAAIGNSCNVDINGEQKGISSLFVLGIASSATGKSAPFKFAAQPLQDIDDIKAAEYEIKYAEYEDIVKMSEAERKAAYITKAPAEPILKKTIVDDFTPEALVKIHKFNPRGLCVYNDEFAQFFNNMGRYGKSGEESAMLKMLDGSRVVNDRIGSGSAYKSIRVPKPCLTMFGTMQTGLLKDHLSGVRNENGLVFRILSVFPEMVEKPEKTKRKILNPDIRRSWKNIIERLSEFPLILDSNNTPIPKELYVSDEADNLHTAWYNNNVKIINNETDEATKSICGKLDIMIYRLALIVQLLNHVCGDGGKEYIEPKAMQAAIYLTEYFRTNAYKVQSYINGSEPMVNIPKRLQDLYNSLPIEFMTKDAHEFGKKLNISTTSIETFLRDGKGKLKLFTSDKKGEYKKAA